MQHLPPAPSTTPMTPPAKSQHALLSDAVVSEARRAGKNIRGDIRGESDESSPATTQRKKVKQACFAFWMSNRGGGVVVIRGVSGDHCVQVSADGCTMAPVSE